MTDRTHLQGDTEPARIPGYGIVPGAWPGSSSRKDRDWESRHGYSPRRTIGCASFSFEPERTENLDPAPL
jgi:hypothetical protein